MIYGITQRTANGNGKRMIPRVKLFDVVFLRTPTQGVYIFYSDGTTVPTNLNPKMDELEHFLTFYDWTYKNPHPSRMIIDTRYGKMHSYDTLGEHELNWLVIKGKWKQ